MELGQEYLPVHKHWRLNERSYGDLVGRNKKEMSKLHGPDQLKKWRRGYDNPPPPMNKSHQVREGRTAERKLQQHSAYHITNHECPNLALVAFGRLSITLVI